MTMRRRRCRRANWLVEATWIELLVVLCYIHNNAVNADEEWRRGGLKVKFFVEFPGAKGKAEGLKVEYGDVERMVRDAVEDNKQSKPAEGGKWLYVWGYLNCVFGVIVYGGGGGGGAEYDPCEQLLQKMGEVKDAKYPTVFEKEVMGKMGVYAAWGKPPDMMTANTKAPRNRFCTIEYVLFRIPDWMTYLEKVTTVPSHTIYYRVLPKEEVSAESHTIYNRVLPKEDWRAFSMVEKAPRYPIPDDEVMMKVDLMQPNM